jgi:ABC-type multidrug transport system ATPase subunit
VPPNSAPEKPEIASGDTAVPPASEGHAETTPTTDAPAGETQAKPVRKAPVRKPAAQATVTAADRSTKKPAPRKPPARKPSARKPTGAAGATVGKAAAPADGASVSSDGASSDGASSDGATSARTSPASTGPASAPNESGAAASGAAASGAAAPDPTAPDPTASDSAAASQSAPAKRTPAKSAPAKTARPAAAKTTVARSTAAKATAAKTAAAKSAAASKAGAARATAAGTTAAKAAAAKAAEVVDPAEDTTAVEKAAEQQATEVLASASEAASASQEAPGAATIEGGTERGSTDHTAVDAVPAVQPAAVAPAAAQRAAVRSPAAPAFADNPELETQDRAAETAAALTTPVGTTIAESPAPVLSAEPLAKARPAPRSLRPAGTRTPRASKQTAPTPDPDAPVVLSVSNLVKRFGENVAVSGIDLEVRAGSFFGIVGPNGAGKTTTLSMITGLLRPDAGSIRVHGIDVWAQPVEAKRIIGVLPDRLRLFDRLTGAQLLYYSGILRGLDAETVRIRSADLVAAFGLEDAQGRLVADYSAGMTKKIALACAMIHSPRILVLDEPFESVDPVSAVNVTEILQKYVASGGTVVLSSHGMDMIQRVCDNVAIIVQGAVLDTGTVEQVRGDKSLEERFVELAGGRKVAEGMEWLHSFSD